MVVLAPLAEATDAEVAFLIALLTGPGGAYVHRQSWFPDDVRNLARHASPDSLLIRQHGRARGYVSITADAASSHWFEIAMAPGPGLDVCGFLAASLVISGFHWRQPFVRVLKTWIHDANSKSLRSAQKMGWVREGREGPWGLFALEILVFLRSGVFKAIMARSRGERAPLLVAPPA